MYSLQCRPQMDHNKYGENGYGPSVDCTVSGTWLMYSCLAHIWPMYDLHTARIVYRVQICDQFCDQICSTHRSPGYPGEKKG